MISAWRERRKQRRQQERERETARRTALADVAEQALLDGGPVNCYAVTQMRDAQRVAVAAVEAYARTL